MPKIFALRDRLQAVQEYLNDNEEHLEIFPEKHFSKSSRHLKSSIPLVETETNCTLEENANRIFEEVLVAEPNTFSKEDYLPDGCNNTTTDHDFREEGIINVTSPLMKENLEENSTNKYQINSAIETSINENNLPEKSQKTSFYVPLNGKSIYTITSN